jgi:hypothetical protein
MVILNNCEKINVSVFYKCSSKRYRSIFFFKKHFFKKKVKINNHFLVFKRAPKGFKYGKQRVSFFNCTFCKEFSFSSCNNLFDITINNFMFDI